MADPFARSTDRVDEQLATLVALQRDCTQQIESVRNRIAEFEAHELKLIATYAGREKRIDGLLDERLLSETAEEIVSA